MDDEDDEDSDYQQPQDLDSDTDSDTDEELDYVSPHDSSMDSDSPLSIAFNAFMQEKVARNAPGSDDFEWKKRENFVTRYGFAGTPGVKEAHLDADSTPRELFDCFFTPNLWKTMMEETNRYAAQHQPNDSGPGPGHMKSWKVVDEKELQRYLGLRLLMGVKPLPSYRDYWSTRPIIGVPAVQAEMPRDRFNAITSHLHFTDNED